VGVRLLAVLAAALALGGSTAPVSGVAFLEQRQATDGGIGERGAPADATSTAWGALALVAGGGSPDARERALGFLRAHEGDVRTDADAALQVLAREALGDRPDALLARLRAYRPGTLVNATAWTAIALRQAGERVPPALVTELRARQQRSGGWSWTRRGAPDSNDTAAVVEALRAAGVKGTPVSRGLAFLARCRNRDGGYGLLPGRASDGQSTAWAIQAFLAAGTKPPSAALRFLSRLRRPDGSYRYSKAYATTPVWVTSQVVPALAHKPFPLAAG
jgi:prenyltransferase beta subunit